MCFEGSTHALAWRVAPGRVRVTVGSAFHEYTVPGDSRASDITPGFLGGSAWRALVRDGDHLVLLDGLRGTVRTFPLPALASEEKPGSLVTTDDAVGLWVRSDEGPYRLHWLLAPGKPHNGLPITSEDGSVAGWMHASDEGIVFEHTSGEFWPPVPQRRPLGVQASGSTVLVRARNESRFFDESGGHAVVLPSGTLTFMAAGAIHTLDPRQGLLRQDARGTTRVWPASAGTDLAGKPLPPGAGLERLQATSFGNEVLVIERIRLADCRGEDRVHLVRLAADTVTVRTLVSDDKIRMHPRYVQDAFRWVEADSNYVSMDVVDRPVFVAE